MLNNPHKIGLNRQLATISRVQGLGLISLGVGVFAVGEFIDAFGWLVAYFRHPMHRFDYGNGEQNIRWILPCTLSIFCGFLSRKTIWGKIGIFLSILVLLGIILMVHWGFQSIQGAWYGFQLIQGS